MKHILLFLFFILTIQNSFAQDCYQTFLNEGVQAYNALDFEKAVNQFKAAQICDDLPSDNEVGQWIEKAQNGYINTIKKERTKAQSLALTAKSILELQKNDDATKAFRYAQYAIGLDDTPDSRSALYECFYKLESAEDRRNFYVQENEMDIPATDGVRTAALIDGGQSIFVSYEDKQVLDLFNFDGQKLGSIPSQVYSFTADAYAEEKGILLGSGKEGDSNYLYAYSFKNSQLNATALFKYQAPERDIEALAFSKDENKIIACFGNGEVHILDLDGKLLYKLKKERDNVKYLSVSNDDYIALAYNGLIKVIKLEVSDYKIILEKQLRGYSNPFVSLSPNNEKVMFCSYRRSIVFNMQGDTLLEKKNMNRHVEGGNFTTDNKLVTFGNEIIDFKNQRFNQSFSPNIRNMAFSPDQILLALNLGGKTAELCYARGTNYFSRGKLGGHDDFIINIGFSPDSTHVLTLSHDQSYKIWNPRMGATTSLYEVGFLKQGLIVENELRMLSSKDNILNVWKANGELANRLDYPVEKILTVSEKGDYIFMNGSNNSIEVWSLDLKNNTTEFQYGITGSDKVQIAAFSGDDRVAIFSNQDFYSLKIWDLKKGKTFILNGSDDVLRSVKWSPDNKRVAAISKSGKLFIWNVEQGSDKAKLEAQWKPHPAGSHNFTFSPDGQEIVTCGWDNRAISWDLKGNQKNIFKGHTFEINAADYSPDGKYLATASEDRTAKVWSSDGTLLVSMEGYDSDIKDIKFSNDGRYIMTRYGDKTIKIWPFDPKLIIDFLESYNLPDLTDEEKKKYGILKD